jgi:hypothetical protein
MSAERYPPPPQSFRCKKEKLLQFKFLVWLAQCLIMLIEILPHQHYNTIRSLKGQGQKHAKSFSQRSIDNLSFEVCRNVMVARIGDTSFIDTNYENCCFFPGYFPFTVPFSCCYSLERLFLSSIAKQLFAPADWSSSCV